MIADIRHHHLEHKAFRPSGRHLKAHGLRLLAMVHATGDELVVSKRGKPVAGIVPAKAGKSWLALRGKERFHGNPENPLVRVDEVEALMP